jgi:dsRNA-specific ribonuclease
VPPVLFDVFEAVAGAVYKDSGDRLEAVKDFFKPYFESAVRNPLPADEVLSDSYTLRHQHGSHICLIADCYRVKNIGKST